MSTSQSHKLCTPFTPYEIIANSLLTIQKDNRNYDCHPHEVIVKVKSDNAKLYHTLSLTTLEQPKIIHLSTEKL